MCQCVGEEAKHWAGAYLRTQCEHDPGGHERLCGECGGMWEGGVSWCVGIWLVGVPGSG